MKLVIISDSHGNIANLKHVLGFASRLKAGAIIHCGDWNNLLAAQTVLNFGIDVYTVLGNADIDKELGTILKEKCKKFDEKFLEAEIGGKKIGIIHKTNDLNIRIQDLDILFCGHTHRPKVTTKDGVKVVNPGALQKEVSFVVYDTETDRLELIKI